MNLKEHFEMRWQEIQDSWNTLLKPWKWQRKEWREFLTLITLVIIVSIFFFYKGQEYMCRDNGGYISLGIDPTFEDYIKPNCVPEYCWFDLAYCQMQGKIYLKDFCELPKTLSESEKSSYQINHKFLILN